MPTTGSNKDFDNFDDWESFTLDDDIYSGTETDLLEDWEDDGAIAEIREPISARITEDIAPDLEVEVQLDEESAEVFSLIERSQAKKNSELLVLAGPSEDELSKIEQVGIDEYIDAVLADEQELLEQDEDEAIFEKAEIDVEEPAVRSIEDVEDETHIESPMMSFGDEEIELVTQPLFEGIACSLPTLFDEEGDVEYKTTARLSKRLSESNVKAFFVATQDGEGNTLSRKERKNLVKGIVKSTEALVVVDVSAPSIRQSVQIADDCADVDAQAFVVTLDSRVKDPYALLDALHQQHKSRALFVNLVGDAGMLPITPEFLYDLPISGVIDSTGDAAFFLHLMSVYSGPVYVGTTQILALGHLMGAQGAVLASVAINQDLVELAYSGDPGAQAELAMWERESNKATGGSARAIKIALEGDFLVSSTMRD